MCFLRTQADDALAQKLTDDVPDLVYSTGPVSYDYHFGARRLFDAVVRRSWLTPGTLFSFDAATLAMDGDQLMGIVIAFHGPEFRKRQAALGPVWLQLVEEGETSQEEITGVLERAEHAMWLNPVVRPQRHYVHAIAVKPRCRGKRVGVALIEDAKRQGRQAGRVSLELDVLSDNPAVHFYRSQGLEMLAETRAPKPLEYGIQPELRMGVALA